MSYIDGFIIPVPEANKEAFRTLAEKTAAIFTRLGAIRVVECWGSDIPDGKLTDFRKAVQAQAGETVVFSWTVWPSKTVRDAANQAMMADPEMAAMSMPFDGKRMILGGFDVLLDTGVDR